MSKTCLRHGGEGEPTISIALARGPQIGRTRARWLPRCCTYDRRHIRQGPGGTIPQIRRAGRRRRHRAVRRMSRALPHPPRSRRGLRPLCQRRGHAGVQQSYSSNGLPKVASRWCPSPARNSNAVLLFAERTFITGIGTGHHLSALQRSLHRSSFRASAPASSTVTVVTEGIFSYCGVKVKIDADRHLGPEQAANPGRC